MIRLELPEDEYQSLVLTKAVYTYVKESFFENDEEKMIQEAIRYLHTKYSREELINRISVYSMHNTVENGGREMTDSKLESKISSLIHLNIVYLSALDVYEHDEELMLKEALERLVQKYSGDDIRKMIEENVVDILKDCVVKRENQEIPSEGNNETD